MGQACIGISPSPAKVQRQLFVSVRILLVAGVLAGHLVVLAHRAETVNVLAGDLTLSTEQVRRKGNLGKKLQSFHAVVCGEQVSANGKRAVVLQKQSHRT